MATILKMPSLSPTMETGVISAWRKQEGEFIEVGEILAEIETDKAVMDYEMPDEGYVRALMAQPGQEIAVGIPIAILTETEDEDIAEALAQAKAAAAAPAPASDATPADQAPAETAAVTEPAAAAPVQDTAQGMAQNTAQAAPAAVSPPPPMPPPPAAPAPPVAAPVPTAAEAVVSSAKNGGRIKISPYGRKLAEQHQIDWHALAGRAPAGASSLRMWRAR